MSNPLGEGVALVHRQSVYEDGAVYLGSDYTSASKIKNQAIKVVAGATYSVRFDYYTTGNTGNMPLKLELTVGNTVDQKMSSIATGAVEILNI